ncbi:glutaredoxin [Cystobasidiomycetes sp. EMM_F5]
MAAASSSNLHAVTSPEHFQQLLSADLERVSVLYFYADWAEPCAAMTQAVAALADAHPAALFLQIEAEALPEVSESFEIDAVPYTILLRGHTLLSRVSGAQAKQLSDEITKHTSTKAGLRSTQPLSKTDAKPEAPPAQYTPSTKSSAPVEAIVTDSHEETQEQLVARCHEIMKQQPVMLFMKGNPDAPRCGFSQKTVNLLRKENIDFGWFDILEDEAVRQELKKINDWPTFPQIIVKGELIGGLDILTEMVDNGELRELMEEV